MNNTKEKLNYFNITKFIASIIIAVMLHYNDHFLPNLNLPNLFSNKMMLFLMTKTGVLVELFFVMAGVLFYVSTRESIINSKKKFGDYFTRKIARLLPVMIVSSLYVYVCNFVLFKSNMPLWSCGSVSLFDLLFSMIQGKMIFAGESSMNAPLWYIGIYIICIIIAYFLTKKSRNYGDKVFLLPIVISFIIFFNFTKILPVLNNSLVRGLSSFFIGIYVGKFLIIYNDFSMRKKVIIKVICVLFLLFYLHCYHINQLNSFYTPVSFAYSLFVFVPLIIFMYDFKNMNKLFSKKLFKFLGNISYSLYVWNFPILITIHLLYIFNIIHFNIYSKLFLLVLLIIHIIVATLSYYFIEEKFKNIKFNFIKKLFN